MDTNNLNNIKRYIEMKEKWANKSNDSLLPLDA